MCDVVVDHYYQAIQINVNQSGFYSFRSSSTIKTYGYIYKDNFIPSATTINLILENDTACGTNQFKLATILDVNTRYILVVTTNSSNVTGNFSIIAVGPNIVTFNHFSKYI